MKKKMKKNPDVTLFGSLKKLMIHRSEIGLTDLKDIQPELLVVTNDPDGRRSLYKVMTTSTDCYGEGIYLYMIHFGRLRDEETVMEIRRASRPVRRREELSPDFFLSVDDLDKKQVSILRRTARHYMNQRSLKGNIVLR